MDKQISMADILNTLKKELTETIRIHLEVQMMKYQEELKELQKIKWKNIFKGIPIGIVIGILVTVLWIH